MAISHLDPLRNCDPLRSTSKQGADGKPVATPRACQSDFRLPRNCFAALWSDCPNNLMVDYHVLIYISGYWIYPHFGQTMTNHDKPTLTYIHIYTLIRNSNIKQERVPQALVLLLENPQAERQIWDTPDTPVAILWHSFANCRIHVRLGLVVSASPKQSSKSDALLGENARWFSQLQAFMAMLLCSGDFPSSDTGWSMVAFPQFSISMPLGYTADCIQAPFPASMRFTHGACCAMTLAPRRVGSCRVPGEPEMEPWAMEMRRLGAWRDNEKAACPCSLKSSVCGWLRTRTPDSLFGCG